MALVLPFSFGQPFAVCFDCNVAKTATDECVLEKNTFCLKANNIGNELLLGVPALVCRFGAICAVLSTLVVRGQKAPQERTKVTRMIRANRWQPR